MGARENKLQKLPIKQNEILHMTILPLFQFLRNLKSISRAPIRNCLCCYYIHLITSIALKKCKKDCDMA